MKNVLKKGMGMVVFAEEKDNSAAELEKKLDAQTDRIMAELADMKADSKKDNANSKQQKQRRWLRGLLCGTGVQREFQ